MSGAAVSWNDIKLSFESDERGSTTRAYNNAAHRLTETEDFLCERPTKRLYWYDPDQGYYVRNGDTYVEERLSENLTYELNETRIRNVTKLVRTASYIDPEDFQPEPGLVCLKEGVLDLRGDEPKYIDHNADYNFRSGLPVEYDPDAESDLWERVLVEWVPDEDRRKTLQEWGGYTLESWHHSHEKNLYIPGPRRSGKSTFTEAVQGLFGDGPPTTVSLSPQQIADKRFDRSFLVDAMLNARNDVNASKIENSGVLKALLSGEQSQFEDKGQDPYFDRATAKHLYNGNWTPRIVNEDEALFRRFIIIPFTEQLTGDEQDRSIKQDLTSDAHRSAILNWAIEGQQRLDEQGEFTIQPSAQATRETWRSWRGPTNRFLAERCNITGDPDDYIPKGDAYDRFKRWATERGFAVVPQQSLTKRWKRVPHVEADDSYDTGENTIKAFTGVRHVGPSPEDEEDEPDPSGQSTF